MTNPGLQFTDYILELLEPLGPLSIGRFFGGVGIAHESVQFAMIMGNSLYFVVGDETRSKYEHAGMQPFSYTTRKGEVKVRRYYEVPEDILADPELLWDWASESIRIAKSTPAPERRRPGAVPK